MVCLLGTRELLGAQELGGGSTAVATDNYIEMADAIAMLYKCRQNPCCWKKLMESLGEMPSATLEAAARKLKDLGNLKQEEVFEMLGKEWGRAVLTAGMAEAVQGSRAMQASEATVTPKTTKEIITRRKKGADGGTSEHVIERDASGNTISRTHQVTTDGKVVHQHQDHIGQHGSVRRFPDSWVEYPEINASQGASR